MIRRPPGEGAGAPPGGMFPGGLLPPLDDRPGPARALAPARRTALVSAIVDAAGVADESAPAPANEPTSGRAWYRALAIAAAILFCLSAAVAPALIRYVTQPPDPRSAEPPPSFVPSRELRPPAAAPTVHYPRAPDPAPDPAPPPSHRRPVAHVEREQEVDVEKAPLEDLLELANRRRRARDWREADRLYRTVCRRFPGSDAAVVAGVASASLHLEQLGDAAGALRDYRDALASQPRGPLSEEARWGIAAAERALGDGAAEREALREFLRNHPGSALVPSARRREAELSR